MNPPERVVFCIKVELRASPWRVSLMPHAPRKCKYWRALRMGGKRGSPVNSLSGLSGLEFSDLLRELLSEAKAAVQTEVVCPLPRTTMSIGRLAPHAEGPECGRPLT
jgi:hypothetical protein